MPILCCFFNHRSKNKLRISAPFVPGQLIPLDTIILQCKRVFGVSTDELSDTTDFAPLYKIGFHDVYGITKNTKGELRVAYLDNLNAFLMANTIAEKKALFLLHSKDRVRQFLVTKNVAEGKLAALEPILQYCAQQCHLASHGPLYAKKSSRVAQEHIGKLGTNVSLALYVGMDIMKLINEEEKGNGLSDEKLSTILTRLDQPTPDADEAAKLGYATLLTKEQAIRNTIDEWKALSSRPQGISISTV